MWRRGVAAPAGMTNDQYDAYTVAAWLRRADHDGRLQSALNPPLTAAERTIAEVEGFLQASGMINLITEQKSSGTQTVGFEINLLAAEKANLKLDTQLVKLAKQIRS